MSSLAYKLAAAALFAVLAGQAGTGRADPLCFTVGSVIPGTPSEEKICCAGLQQRGRKEDFDAGCDSLPVGGHAGICIPCGDGLCDAQYETRCNCPEDCNDETEKK